VNDNEEKNGLADEGPEMRTPEEVRARYDELVRLQYVRGAAVKAGALEILEWVLCIEDPLPLKPMSEIILDIIDELQKGLDECDKGGVPLDDILNECKCRGIESDMAIVTLHRLTHHGDIYCPARRRYKVLQRS